MTEGEIVTAATHQELESDVQLEFFEDIFDDFVGHQTATPLKEDRKLEVIPLGRMRGRTFNNAFIIIDEAQNITVPKMWMAPSGFEVMSIRRAL